MYVVHPQALQQLQKQKQLRVHLFLFSHLTTLQWKPKPCVCMLRLYLELSHVSSTSSTNNPNGREDETCVAYKPAVTSAPLMTTVVDSSGLVIYFLTARAIMPRFAATAGGAGDGGLVP